ncbi:variable surface protein [Plasmodium gonderi]|uniref:Variable surface protein n=1 Tax=Plasmodium gonderi TaxID=77519 RepID=A0A1Y1JVW3_PLAGO|nr:variable surface protein [Plasmodium gonderi]GAW84024.1 variable surface protein [Plasmodium gonderi]
MWSNIYEYIIYFPRCKKELENEKKEPSADYKNECKPIMKGYLTDNNLDENNICTTATSYIHNISRTHNPIPENAICSYMYYWIYHELINIGKSCDTKKLYKEFLTLLKNNGVQHPCITYADSINSYDHFEKVKYLYETSLCLNTIEHEEEYTSFRTIIPYKLKRKISEFKNKDEEMNMLDQYEDFNSITIYNGYNIVYSSD